MNKYRTHLCSELNISNLNEEVRLSGWVDTIRDHGNLVFIDLRDNYGITQCVLDGTHNLFDDISNLNHESVITIIGRVIERSSETINKSITTGEIEIKIESYILLASSDTLPLPAPSDRGVGVAVAPKRLP